MLDVHPTVVVLLQSLLFLLQPLKQAPAGLLLPPPVAGYVAAQASRPHRTPIAGLAIPLLTHTCCYSPGTADKPVNPRTPPCGKQLPSIPWLHVVPFLGLAVVHRPSALGAEWSTWSRNSFHRTWTIRGEADSWVHGCSKEVTPYYAQNNYSST